MSIAALMKWVDVLHHIQSPGRTVASGNGARFDDVDESAQILAVVKPLGKGRPATSICSTQTNPWSSWSPFVRFGDLLEPMHAPSLEEVVVTR